MRQSQNITVANSIILGCTIIRLIPVPGDNVLARVSCRLILAGLDSKHTVGKPGAKDGINLLAVTGVFGNRDQGDRPAVDPPILVSADRPGIVLVVLRLSSIACLQH